MNIQALKLISSKKKTSHVLHFIISVCLFLMLPAAGIAYAVIWWPIVALSNHLENVKIDRKLDKMYH